MGRLNGLFRGVFSTESWTLSQSYYFGRLRDNPSHRVEIVDGMCIDQIDELDECWMGRPGGVAQAAPDSRHTDVPTDVREDAELIRCIVTGEHLHVEMCALAARYVGRGMPVTAVANLLRGVMLSHSESTRDARWQDRYQSIDALVQSAARKFGGQQVENRRAIARIAHRMASNWCAADDIQTAVIAEAERCGMQRASALALADRILGAVAKNWPHA